MNAQAYFTKTEEGNLALNVGTSRVIHVGSRVEANIRNYSFRIIGEQWPIMFALRIPNLDITRGDLFKKLLETLLTSESGVLVVKTWTNRHKGQLLEIWNALEGRESIAPNLDWSEAVN